MKEFVTDSTDPCQTDVPRVHWSDAKGFDSWRLGWISRLNENLFPPSRKSSELVECERHDLLLAQFTESSDPIILLGEAGSGMKSFIHFLETQAIREPKTPQQGKTTSKNQYRLTSIDLSGLPDANQPEQQKAALIQALGRTVGDEPAPATIDQDLPSVLNRLATASGELSHVLVVKGLAGLANSLAVRFFSLLRSFIEQNRLGALRPVLLAHDLKQVQMGPFSYLSPLCHVFVTPRFGAQEIGQLWLDHIEPGDPRPEKAWLDELGQQCVEWTGGQPLLVRLFLKHVSEWPTLYEKPEQCFETAGHWLRDHPPTQVKRWQEHLADLVRQSYDVQRAMNSYLERRTDDSIDRILTPLYVAGWIGLRKNGHWGIRSNCHAAWARPMLRNVGGRPRVPVSHQEAK